MIENPKRHGSPVESTLIKERETSWAIRSRVLAFFEGADQTKRDGTPQQVGPYMVSIMEMQGENGAVRTTFRAATNGLPLALYSQYRDSVHPLTERYELHGAVDKSPVTLSVIRANHKIATCVSLPNPHLVTPGSPHSADVGDVSPEYRVKVSRAFGIDLPRQPIPDLVS